MVIVCNLSLADLIWSNAKFATETAFSICFTCLPPEIVTQTFFAFLSVPKHGACTWTKSHHNSFNARHKMLLKVEEASSTASFLVCHVTKKPTQGLLRCQGSFWGLCSGKFQGVFLCILKHPQSFVHIKDSADGTSAGPMWSPFLSQ